MVNEHTHALTRVLRRMSSTTELCLIIGITLGIPLATAFSHVLRGTTRLTLSDRGIIVLCAYELATLVLIGIILRIRGWSIADLAITPSIRGTLWGVLVFILAVLSYWTIALLVGYFVGNFDFMRQVRLGSSASFVWITILSLINPVFEESIATAYVINRFRNAGPVVAVGTSSLLRVLYHLYQGPLAFIGVLPFGIVFASFYWWRWQLWPLLVAHGLGDIIGIALAKLAT